jgi:hypothetical protein
VTTITKVGGLQRALMAHMPASEEALIDMAERSQRLPGAKMHEVRKQARKALASLVRRGFVEVAGGEYRVVGVRL